jgi:hypothetical protein
VLPPPARRKRGVRALAWALGRRGAGAALVNGPVGEGSQSELAPESTATKRPPQASPTAKPTSTTSKAPATAKAPPQAKAPPWPNGPQPPPSRGAPTRHHGVPALPAVPEKLRRAQPRAGAHHALGGLAERGGRLLPSATGPAAGPPAEAPRPCWPRGFGFATECQTQGAHGRPTLAPNPPLPPSCVKRGATCGVGVALGLRGTTSPGPSAGTP